MPAQITESMRVVLKEAARRQEGLRRLHGDQPGSPPWPAHPSTLAALVRRGLLERASGRTRRGSRIDTWRITEAGRLELNPPAQVMQDRPLYLARGSVRYRLLPDNRWAVDESGSSGDYTSDPHRSIDNDRHPTTEKTTAVEVLVTPADIANFTREARERETARRQQHGRTLDTHPLGDRLTRLRPIAREQRVDIHGEHRLIRHLISQGRDTAAEGRLTQLETQLGQRAA